MADTDFNIGLTAGLDLEESVKAIAKDIAELQKRIEASGSKIKLKAELDKNILQSIKNLGTTRGQSSYR